jgi:hypothetical protein
LKNAARNAVIKMLILETAQKDMGREEILLNNGMGNIEI